MRRDERVTDAMIKRSHQVVDDVLDMALYLRNCSPENIGKHQDAANRLAYFMDEVRAALSAALSEQTLPVRVEIPAGLVQRCTEIIAWKKTGKLPGDALRNLGKAIADRLGGSLFIDNGLNQAELQTIDEALRLVVSLRPAEVGPATDTSGTGGGE